MFKKQYKLLKKLERALNEDFRYLPDVFCDKDTNDILEEDEMLEFCKFWIKSRPDLYIRLKEELINFREKMANVFSHVGKFLEPTDERYAKLSGITKTQMYLLVNNSIDETNSIMKFAQVLIVLCERVLAEE